jgi:hypothetical protein
VSRVTLACPRRFRRQNLRHNPTAPRLAGQTRQYIEKQVLKFKNHTRDNPYSQQYMWGASANINSQMRVILPAICLRCQPNPPMMDTESLWPLEERYTNEGSRIPISLLASSAMVPTPKGLRVSHVWEGYLITISRGDLKNGFADLTQLQDPCHTLQTVCRCARSRCSPLT